MKIKQIGNGLILSEEGEEEIYFSSNQELHSYLQNRQARNEYKRGQEMAQRLMDMKRIAPATIGVRLGYMTPSSEVPEDIAGVVEEIMSLTGISPDPLSVQLNAFKVEQAYNILDKIEINGLILALANKMAELLNAQEQVSYWTVDGVMQALISFPNTKEGKYALNLK